MLGVTGAMAAIAAAPAQGHWTCAAQHGNDYACVNETHSIIYACDAEADGHGVRAHWRDISYNVTIGSWDTSGADGGCAQDYFPPSAVQFRVCENEVGCSAWFWE